MESFFVNILPAIGIVLDPVNLFVIPIGIIAGIALGVLPGFGGAQALALMFPFTFIMTAEQAILFMTAVYSAAEYGGSIPAILIRTPGTTAAAMTILDGFPMAQRGDAYRALMISLTAGVTGGILSSILFIVAASALAWIGLQFGPSEMFALGVLGLCIIGSFVGKDPSKGFLMAGFGLLLSTFGESPFGMVRFSFGLPFMFDGIPLIVMIISMLAAPEVFRLMGMFSEKQEKENGINTDSLVIKSSTFSWKDYKRLLPSMFRGTVIGTTVGAIPGPGPTVAAVIAYNEEKRWAKTDKEFGTGVDEGIAAPESSNNAVVAGALVPALALGIPGSGAIAVLIGLLVSKNIVPGPMLFSHGGPLVLAIFVGLIAGNLFLLLFGILGMKPFAAIVKIPARILGPFIMLMIIVGAYSYNNQLAHSAMVLVLGSIAYWLDKFKFSTIPVILGFVMGPIIEINLNRALLITQGDFVTVISRPITMVILVLAVITAFFSYFRSIKK